MLAAALRTLGDVAEAEDVVQDAWLRWQRADRAAIRNPPAFLSTTSKRLALNRALGARTRYETPMDPWMAEPIHLGAGPGTCVERGQRLESALLLLLAKLSAVERAAYLLREAFGCSYRHISQVISSSEANSRQLVTRARKRLADRQPVLVDDTGLSRISAAFVNAVQEGDLSLLEAVLSADISRRHVPR
jgi:RNA polymerase sigma-70 factor, ECF subfamily